jgi:hypothetical protein
MLTFAEIVEATKPADASREAWRSYLNRCLAKPEIKEVARAKEHPKYPYPESLAVFYRLADLQKEGYAPPDVAAILRKELSEPERVRTLAGQPDSTDAEQAERPSAEQVAAHRQAIARRNQGAGELTVVVPQQITDSMALLVEILREMATPAAPIAPAAPPEDRIIEAGEAALMLSCKPGSVVRLLRKGGVNPVRPGRWKRSAILKYIERA